MQYCRECGTKMVGVMSFSNDRRENFDRCPRCYSETKHRVLDERELSFGEVLKKTRKIANKHVR